MKPNIKNLALAIFCCSFAASCTTNVIEQEPDDPSYKPGDANEVTVNFRVMPNSYTRATSEDDLESLYLAFYKINSNSSKFIELKKVETSVTTGTTMTMTLALSSDRPNAVVAYANVSNPTDLNDALNNNPSTSDLCNDNGCIIMSSARYYDTGNNNADIYFSKISDEDLENGNVIDIYLERIPAKVTVSSENLKAEDIHTIDKNGNLRKLNLTLTHWDIFGTDKATYYLKNNGNLEFSKMEDILGSNDKSTNWNWNNLSNHSLNWAYSVNYINTGIIPAIGEESEASDTYHPKFSDVSNNFGNSALFNETTRPYTSYATPNAKPSLVLTGQYTVDGEENSQTLYRQGNLVYTESELIDHFAEINKEKSLFYYKNGNSVIEYNAKNIANSLTYSLLITYPESEKGIMPNIVTLQIPTNNKEICDASSNLYTGNKLTEINKTLADEMGLWEVYFEGNCFFHIPIEHTGKATDSNGTGSYGLVRNHHYRIELGSIEGIGHGVPSTETYLGEWSFDKNLDDIQNLKYSISINPWTDVNQSINITR